jgi:hypothetical protein
VGGTSVSIDFRLGIRVWRFRLRFPTGARHVSLLNRYNDYAVGWTIEGSNPGRAKRYVQSPKKSPDRLWGPYSVLFNGYGGSFREVKRSGVKLTIHLRLVPRLRMSGTIPLLLHIILLYWPVWLYRIGPCYLINGTIFGRKSYWT